MLTSPFIAAPLLVATFAAAYTLIGYEHHARSRGWPAGSWLCGALPPLKVLALLDMPLVAWKALWLWTWWTVPLVLAAGFALAFVATIALRSTVQIPAVLITVLGGIATLLVGAQVQSLA